MKKIIFLLVVIFGMSLIAGSVSAGDDLISSLSYLQYVDNVKWVRIEEGKYIYICFEPLARGYKGVCDGAAVVASRHKNGFVSVFAVTTESWNGGNNWRYYYMISAMKGRKLK